MIKTQMETDESYNSDSLCLVITWEGRQFNFCLVGTWSVIYVNEFSFSLEINQIELVLTVMLMCATSSGLCVFLRID